jgi:catechol 2,3-dioxygenase-like lactoylglutathione lyase family enzyme
MSPAKVRALRSVDIGLADADAGAAFFDKVWNLIPVAVKDGVHYLRGSGPFHHLISVHRTDKQCVVRMTFDAADRATVDALYAQVKAQGAATIDPPAPLRQPHGTYGFGFKDPEGRNVAVVCGVEDHADAADRPDRPTKLSHININAGASDATVAFYCAALGFSLSDTTKKLRFLSCNNDHHNVVVGFSGGPTLNHLAFEMVDLDAVMRGAGRMRDAGHGIEWGPGRHGAGNNVFCYFLGPEDFPIEYTSEMQQIDASYRPGGPADWTWPPGRLDQWGITAAPSKRIEDAGLNVHFTDDGWRLDAWR